MTLRNYLFCLTLLLNYRLHLAYKIPLVTFSSTQLGVNIARLCFQVQGSPSCSRESWDLFHQRALLPQPALEWLRVTSEEQRYTTLLVSQLSEVC